MIFTGRPTTEPWWKSLLARVFGRKVGRWTYWRGKLYWTERDGNRLK